MCYFCEKKMALLFEGKTFKRSYGILCTTIIMFQLSILNGGTRT